MSKKVLALLITFLMAAAFVVGCGPEEEDNQDDNQNQDDLVCSVETQDEDCDEGQICDEEANDGLGECVEEGGEDPVCTEATQEEDCDEGQICDEAANDGLGECVSDS